MFKYISVKDQILFEKIKNEELTARLLEQRVIIDELTEATLELASIISGKGVSEDGETVSQTD
jgi:hypothetical protein